MSNSRIPLVPVLCIQFLTPIASVSRADDAKAPLLADVIEISFAKPAYEFTLAEAAQGIKIDYTIEVRQDFAGVVPLPQGSCAPARPSGLFAFEVLSGNGQLYALRDRGRCQGPSRVPITIKKGTYSQVFEWDGRNWNGPSDTNQPKGKPFPAGTYGLEVSVVGEVETPAGRKPYRIEKHVKVVIKP